ncbi:hypothetical protein HDV00_006512 [Rhizophlyctis rosea]|nr:hypothetical protein HDV00_006512 [Rhizophlyctis rosea]
MPTCKNPFTTSHVPPPSSLPSHSNFTITLVNLDDALINAYEKYLSPYLSSNGGLVTTEWNAFQFLTHPYDALVSPANSFGLMDGGVDYHISFHLGGSPAVLVPYVQRVLLDRFAGQQPVGTAVLIDVGNVTERYLDDPGNHFREIGMEDVRLPRFLIHTPTMRTPRLLGSNTEVPYDAMWSVLTSIRAHNIHALSQNQPENLIRSVVIPGFGTSVGGVSPELGARQVALAYRHFIENVVNIEGRMDEFKCGRGGERGGVCHREVEKDYLVGWDYVESLEDEIRRTWGCDY